MSTWLAGHLFGHVPFWLPQPQPAPHQPGPQRSQDRPGSGSTAAEGSPQQRGHEQRPWQRYSPAGHGQSPVLRIESLRLFRNDSASSGFQGNLSCLASRLSLVRSWHRQLVHLVERPQVLFCFRPAISLDEASGFTANISAGDGCSHLYGAKLWMLKWFWGSGATEQIVLVRLFHAPKRANRPENCLKLRSGSKLAGIQSDGYKKLSCLACAR